MNDELYRKDTSGCGCSVALFVLIILAVSAFAMLLTEIKI